MKKQLTALGGDVFAGLFTYGVRQAGYKILGHLEHTTYGTATARLNYPDLDIRNGAHTWHPEEFTGKVDFMYTNPPCAAWSAMQISKPWEEHTERLQIVRDLVAAGQIVKPKAWCWESVMGAWRRGRSFVLEQAESWLAHGYHVTVLLQNNMYLGVSQNRPRMFLIAHRYPLVWPPFTPPLTVAQFLKTVPRRLPKTDIHHPPLPESFRRLWEDCTSTGYVLRRALVIKDEAEQRKLHPRPAMVVNRMKADEVPGVFIGARQRLHPFEPRYLNWHECLTLAGLPLDWKTSQCHLESASYELSRAVMPAVGKWLGTAVRQGLERPALNRRRPVATLVDLRDPEQPFEELLMTYAPPPVAPPVLWDPQPPSKAPRTPSERGREAREPRAPRSGPVGSGARIRELLEKGWDTERILETIHREYPSSKATSADVSWNRRKLRQLNGEL